MRPASLVAGVDGLATFAGRRHRHPQEEAVPTPSLRGHKANRVAFAVLDNNAGLVGGLAVAVGLVAVVRDNKTTEAASRRAVEAVATKVHGLVVANPVPLLPSTPQTVVGIADGADAEAARPRPGVQTPREVVAGVAARRPPVDDEVSPAVALAPGAPSCPDADTRLTGGRANGVDETMAPKATSVTGTATRPAPSGVVHTTPKDASPVP